MRDYLTLEATPVGEDCSQVGVENYSHMSRIECSVFKDQLERTFPKCNFGVKSFPHDFGTYREVVVYFDDENEEESENAFEVESNLPEFWDDVAKKLLREAGYMV